MDLNEEIVSEGGTPRLQELAVEALWALPVAAMAFDATGRALWWNEAAHALFGADLSFTTLEDVEAAVADQPGRLQIRKPIGAGADSTGLTWLVVVESPEENTLLEAFAHQALHDHLTELPNRSLLDDRIRQALNRASRSEGCVAVVFLDLDHFKLINDTQGHAEGDALLRAVAERLSNEVRASDTVARFGGDEFVVVCEEVEGEDEATELAERLRVSLEPPFVLRGEDVYVSASLGVAVGRPGSLPEELLRDADAAMYHAKLEGRARTELFDEGIRTRAELRRYTESALRRALDAQQFELLYQPIVSLDAGWIVGAEALIRWHDPERGLVLPDDFIPVAEESGQILAIGEWVIDEACRQLSQWRVDLPHVPLVMSVNVSARQIRNRLTGVIAQCAGRWQVDPSLLVLEITEGVLMHDVPRCLEDLLELKRLGLRIAVDDFGVGYSSLGYLKRFPIDIIKIDRAFIAGLGLDANDSAIVAAIAGIARALRVSVVAEGVETPEQLYALRHLTCELAQGLQFAAPLAPEDFAQLLRSGPRW